MNAHDEMQMKQEEEEREIVAALVRVSTGLAGQRDAALLAAALGPRFRDDNDLRKGDA
jgi:hypothetical protein